MLTNAFHSALEFGKHVFTRASVPAAAHLSPAVGGDDVVDRRLFAEFGVDADLVGMQGAVAGTLGANDAADFVFGCAVNVDRAVGRELRSI